MAEIGPLEAVRQAVGTLGENATPDDIAGYTLRTFGVHIKPGIVKILLASLLERGVVEQARQRAQEGLAQRQAEEAAQGGSKKPRKRAKKLGEQAEGQDLATRPGEQR